MVAAVVRRKETPIVTAEEDPILSPEEVGRMIGKAGITIRRWIQDGLLTAIKSPSNRWGVRLSQVKKMLEPTDIPMKLE